MSPPRLPKLPSSDITPERVYLSRREILAGAAATAVASTLGIGSVACAKPADKKVDPSLAPPAMPPAETQLSADGTFVITRRQAMVGDEDVTKREDATTYNNYYEFGTGKADPSVLAGGFTTRPWTVECVGACGKPGVYDIDKLIGLFPLEERVYRFRCVEAWSMVLPWVGFPLSSLLKRLEPTGNAKYVAFESVLRPDEMPGQKRRSLDWPYVEGLRMDEAMNPLTLLGLGLYGKVLPNQNGAPIRLVVPWKYGFKSAKAIVRIRLMETEPPTSWNKSGPDEYGFYSNVNPAVDHPRWSQAKERRIGDFLKRKTLPFNGYGDQVAAMYAGMDLHRYF